MKHAVPQTPPDYSGLIDEVTDFGLSLHAMNNPANTHETWWSVLIELEKISINEFEVAVSDYAKDLIIPVAYDATDRAKHLPLQPVAVYARKPLIDALNRLGTKQTLPVSEFIASIRKGAETPHRFLNAAATAASMDDIVVSDDTVVTAILDDGIAIAHDLFRGGPMSTRVFYAHIFDAEPVKSDGHTSVGRALDQFAINTLLETTTFDELLDEDLFYAKTKQVDFAEQVFSTVALRRSHGTHVSALAAGYDMGCSCANRPILCAMLPSRVIDDTTGVDMLPNVYLAFHLLAKQASRFKTKDGTPSPVVFNFSYGNAGGPHDGTGVFANLFEYYFGQDSNQKAWLTLPAANINLSQTHAVDDPCVSRGDVTAELRVLPDDRTPSHVQIWMPNSDETDQIDFATIDVFAPFHSDPLSIKTQPNQRQILRNHNGTGEEIARLTYEYRAGATQRGFVTLSIAPTAALKGGSAVAPAGVWKIQVRRNKDTPQKPIHMWVRRDETLPGLRPGGRQAYFCNADYEKYGRFGMPLAVDPPDSTSPVRRSSTISGFACGKSPIVVAAYSEKEAEMSSYSAAGPLNPSNVSENRTGPDLVGKGDESYVLRGVLSAGSRSGTRVRLSGTSVAAPRVARAATDHILYYDGDARAWSHDAPKLYPFPLKGDPQITRAGAGAVRIPVFAHKWPNSE